jgi:hypothetical protein
VIPLLDPWTAVADGDALEAELRREVAPGHALYGRGVRALARRTDCDEVLFALVGSDECAVVHLTWTGKAERAPLPFTATFPSVPTWASTAMTADHAEFAGDP